MQSRMNCVGDTCHLNATHVHFHLLLENMEGLSSSGEPPKCQLTPTLRENQNGVWNYFGFPAQGGEFIKNGKKKRTMVLCKLCPKQFPYQGHIELSHQIIHEPSQHFPPLPPTLTPQQEMLLIFYCPAELCSEEGTWCLWWLFHCALSQSLRHSPIVVVPHGGAVVTMG